MNIKKQLKKNETSEQIEARMLDFVRLETFLNSSKHNRFTDLDKLVTSKTFIENKKRIESLSYKKSDLRKTEKLHQKLSKKKDIKKYLVDNTHTVKDQNLLNNFIELDNKIKSTEFINEKNFLINKNRFQTTEDYQKLQEYNQLIQDNEVIAFRKYNNDSRYQEFRSLNSKISEDFSSNSIDTNLWTHTEDRTNGLLNKNIGNNNSRFYFTNGENVRINNNRISLNTKKESTKGMYLDPVIGFKEKVFEYSSAYLSTFNKFSLQYGKIEAKIKVGSMDINQVFGLRDSKSNSHIDIIRTIDSKKAECGIFHNNKSQSEQIKKVALNENFYIYSLIWTANKLEWRINDVTVFSTTNNIPTNPMFICLYNSINEKTKSTNTDTVIDWIKVYAPKEQ